MILVISNQWRRSFACFLLTLPLLLVASAFASQLAIPDENALWQVVHYACVPHQQLLSNPWPCDKVDLRRGIASGYAVLADPTNKTQVLVIPTARISGIESPAILASSAANYWWAAWRARKYVEERAGKAIPPQDAGLAINSVGGRSQNQLHIHVDCLRRSVKQALLSHQNEIKDKWAGFRLSFAGHRYRVMKIAALALKNVNPFKLLLSVPTAKANMGQQTLVIAGAVFTNGAEGFYILTDRAKGAGVDRAHGEELLDHKCELIKQKRHPSLK